MSKNNIAQQYNSMVASIEDAKIYDGRGEYNLYECNKCNNYKVTLYKDKGVTPFIMRCKCFLGRTSPLVCSFFLLNSTIDRKSTRLNSSHNA